MIPFLLTAIFALAVWLVLTAGTGDIGARCRSGFFPVDGRDYADIPVQVTQLQDGKPGQVAPHCPLHPRPVFT